MVVTESHREDMLTDVKVLPNSPTCLFCLSSHQNGQQFPLLHSFTSIWCHHHLGLFLLLDFGFLLQTNWHRHVCACFHDHILDQLVQDKYVSRRVFKWLWSAQPSGKHLYHTLSNKGPRGHCGREDGETVGVRVSGALLWSEAVSSRCDKTWWTHRSRGCMYKTCTRVNRSIFQCGQGQGLKGPHL